MREFFFNFLFRNSFETLRCWLDEGYKYIQILDQVYSSWLCVLRSIKTTSVKLSGTVSFLAGVNPARAERLLAAE